MGKKQEEKMDATGTEGGVGGKPKASPPIMGTFSGTWDFFLAGIQECVGLGNVWRFPYLVARYGGGTFLLIYGLMFLVVFPFFFLEVILGQFTSRGPVETFQNLSPAFAGLGWAMIGIQLMFSLQYNGILAWALFYMLSSVKSSPEWSICEIPAGNNKTSPCFSGKNFEVCHSQCGFYFRDKCYSSGEETAALLSMLEQECFENDEDLPPKCNVHLRFNFTDSAKFKELVGGLKKGEWQWFDKCKLQWTSVTKERLMSANKKVGTGFLTL